MAFPDLIPRHRKTLVRLLCHAYVILTILKFQIGSCGDEGVGQFRFYYNADEEECQRHPSFGCNNEGGNGFETLETC